ncbi:hypothetical protein INT43_006999 [Umbelopsis isabellina]|uniref:RGS domain-containing protein n=1 Tax=Mortierella isabellina TaxID=91625 RepID=A0A8H7PXF9_MORIS|nr:hypothetical protein INT43_006999 [Umbelopsis isabellina]
MLFIPSSRKSTDSTKVLRYDESPPDVEISRQVPSQVPTLQQILDRKSLPPVCLYNLYIVMRDRLGNEEVLDFYLDLRHHEVLWRKYIRSLFRANLIDDNDLAEGVNSLPLAIKVQGIQNNMAEQIRQTNVSNTKHFLPPSAPASAPNDFAVQYKDQLQNAHYIQESAESILHRYVVQSAHKEISLPSTIRDDITICIQENLRYDPRVFELAKLWAMNIIQHFSYPEFIHIKSNGNITQGQQLLRICIGLASLFLGFTVELTMLFLGWQMWGARAWVCNPYSIHKDRQFS